MAHIDSVFDDRALLNPPQRYLHLPSLTALLCSYANQLAILHLRDR